VLQCFYALISVVFDFYCLEKLNNIRGDIVALICVSVHLLSCMGEKCLTFEEIQEIKRVRAVAIPC